MQERQLDTRTCRISLGGDGIVRILYVSGIEETLEHAKENVAAVTTIADGKKRPLLIDISGLGSIEQRARQYFAGEEPSKVALATALITNSPVARIIGSFFLGLNKPNFPVRLFTSEREATRWLRGFLQ
jgi:hypothetical protein